MSFEIALRSRLTGTAASTRVYWGIRPQATALPAILLSTVSGMRDQHYEGVISAQGNRVQIDCLASSKAAAVSLRDAVMAIIKQPAIVGDDEFQAGFVNIFRDLVEDTASGVVHTEMIDATIWHNEYVS